LPTQFEYDNVLSIVLREIRAHPSKEVQRTPYLGLFRTPDRVTNEMRHRGKDLITPLVDNIIGADSPTRNIEKFHCDVVKG